MAINPTITIVGNGVIPQVSSSYNPNNSFWSVTTQNLPGLVSVGTYPNPLAPYAITSSTQVLTIPYRGGRNYTHTPPTDSTGIVGISCTGFKFESARSSFTRIYNNKTWTIDHFKANLLGIDQYGGYVNSSGNYRYISGQFLKLNPWISIFPFNRGWRYKSSTALLHSFLIGWSLDGYPIYGPYGHDDPLNPKSPIVRLRTGYKQVITSDRPPSKTVYVNGNYTAQTAITLFTGRDLGIGMIVTGIDIPPDVKIKNIIGQTIYLTVPITISSGQFLNCYYPPGYFCEDNIYDTTNSPHLDIHNGRFCVTPDYPEGTYAYFLSVDSSENSIYPYIIGPTFYGRLTADSTNTNLVNITPSVGSLNPSFSTSIKTYDLFVANQYNNINISGRVEDPKSSLYPYQTFYNTKLLNDQNFNVIGLQVSEVEPFTFIVKSEYETTGTYQVNITRLPSTDNLLLNFEIDGYQIYPNFNPLIDLYSITVPNSSISVSLILTSANAFSTITVNDKIHQSGTSVKYFTKEGINEFNINVIAQNGSIRTYNLDVTRLNNDAYPVNLAITPPGLLPQFDINTFYYNYNLPYSTSTVSITPTIADNSTTVIVNNIPTLNLQPRLVTDIPESFSLITVRTKSNDPSIEYTYRILVNRSKNPESKLLNIALSTGTIVPSFTSTTYIYTATIANTTTNITITPIAINTGSIIQVNNQSIISGQTSTSIPLIVGQNTIRLIVLGEDRTTTSTYLLNVIRSLSNISRLKDLKVLGYPLGPIFSSNTFSYISTVSNWVQSTYIIPVAEEPNAVISINNITVQSGSLSQELALNVGLNTATIKVISQDFKSTSTYILNINRLFNTENRLKYTYSSNRPSKAYQIKRATDPIEIAKLTATGWVYIRDNIYALRRIPFST